MKTSARQERAFEVTGRVLSVDPLAKTVRIAHQAIPEYMPAMAMPFKVAQASLLKGLQAGDTVHFQLVVTDSDSWIAHMRKILNAASNQAAEPIPTKDIAEPAPDIERLQLGETMPNFALTDENGQPVRLSDFRGQAVVLTFVYTRCPLPNFCPLMSRNFEALQERLAKSCAGRFHLLSVSIDPEFDKPEILKSYALRYGAERRYWSFGTGAREQIDAVATLLGLTHEPENGFIAHDLRTALISPEGKLVRLWKSNTWTPYEVEREVREVLSGPRPARFAQLD